MIDYTYTFATMEVSQATYDEIAGKLREAGYDHAFVKSDDGVLLDMHGVAIAPPARCRTLPRPALG